MFVCFFKEKQETQEKLKAQEIELMDAMGQKNNAMTEYGHVTNKYVYYINNAN